MKKSDAIPEEIMRRRTRVRRRAGFTLIELLVVIVVIGILAAIAAAKYSEVRNRSFRAVTQNDLKNAATKQEYYHSKNLDYAADIADMDVVLSPGVTVDITHNSPTGWSGQATHSADPDILCGVYVGTAPPAGGAPATSPDRVVCAD